MSGVDFNYYKRAKEGTAPIFKQALWGCHKITNGSTNMFLATVFDKTDFSVKRYSKQLLNKSQFISCRLAGRRSKISRMM